MFQLKKIFFLCSMILLSACSRKKPQAMVINSSKDTIQLEESVARMTHIPDAPFGFRLQAVIPDQQDSESAQIIYYPVKGSVVDIGFIKKQYESEMELLGWQLMSTFESVDELFLLFCRPGNVWCQIILSHENILTIMILGRKKDQS